MNMDIFDVLKAISTRKMELMHTGISENDALIKAEFYVSKDYHISLPDIKKIGG